MVLRKGGLGRGLDSLLSSDLREAVSKEPGQRDKFQEMPVEWLQRGQYQPRMNINPEELASLADSIKAQGIVQPVIIRAMAEGRYEIIAGERRWRAAQLAGLRSVPVIIRDVSDQAALALSLIENIQRKDLNPIEEANALQRLIEEFDMTHSQAADAVGRSRTAVTNLLRLLALEEAVLVMIGEEKLEMGHARALLGVTGGEQIELARQVANLGLSVRKTEELVRRQTSGGKPAPSRAEPQDANLRSLETELSERLGYPVQLRHQSSGKGSLIVKYNNLDELDGILERFK